MDWKGRKVLVTGGGFIGSHLVNVPLERGAEVTTFVRYTSRGSAGFLDPICSRICIVASYIAEFDGVCQAMEDQDSVFHLAALIGIPFSFGHPWGVVQVSTTGTQNVLSAACQTVPRRMVLTSTSEVMHLCGDGGKDGGLIGWKPTFTLDEGLLHTVDWLNESGGVDDPARYHI